MHPGKSRLQDCRLALLTAIPAALFALALAGCPSGTSGSPELSGSPGSHGLSGLSGPLGPAGKTAAPGESGPSAKESAPSAGSSSADVQDRAPGTSPPTAVPPPAKTASPTPVGQGTPALSALQDPQNPAIGADAGPDPRTGSTYAQNPGGGDRPGSTGSRA